MTDIVERLLKIAEASRREDGSLIPLGLEITEAADEITRLRQLLSEAEKREREARAKALEEAAKVADQYAWDDHALAQATSLGKAVHHQSVEIAVAIRALQSEER